MSKKAFEFVELKSFSLKYFDITDPYSFSYYGTLFIDDKANVLLSLKNYGEDAKIYSNGKGIAAELGLNELKMSDNMNKVNCRLSYPYVTIF